MTAPKPAAKPAPVDPAVANLGSPAVVPEPEVPVPSEYKVTGPHEVLGHQPGSRFTALLDPIQEESLVFGGHIAPIPQKET